MPQRDTVLRWIEQLGPLVARLLRRGTPEDFALVREELAEAEQSLLGSLGAVLPHLEPEAAADLLHDPDRIFAWAVLMGLRASFEHAAGADATAASTRLRAIAIAEAAVRRIRVPRPEWDAWLATQRAAVPM